MNNFKQLAGYFYFSAGQLKEELEAIKANRNPRCYNVDSIEAVIESLIFQAEEAVSFMAHG
jgi:hypothetical protein